MTMATKNDIESARQTPKALAQICESLGYTRSFGQLQFDNGAFVSSILDFFDDNPGAIEAIYNFMLENAEALNVEEESEEQDDEDSGEVDTDGLSDEE
jgi:hypothetical protein